MKTIRFARYVAVPVLLVSIFALQAADKPASDNPLQGEWKFTTVGKEGQYGQNPQALSQTFTLTFEAKKVKGKAITGKPFGFDITSSRASQAKPGGTVSFSTSYERGGGTYSIDWRGKLSDDGKKITDGKFSLIVGSGTFIAEKQ